MGFNPADKLFPFINNNFIPIDMLESVIVGLDVPKITADKD